VTNGSGIAKTERDSLAVCGAPDARKAPAITRLTTKRGVEFDRKDIICLITRLRLPYQPWDPNTKGSCRWDVTSSVER
jgi:hypothetical protein